MPRIRRGADEQPRLRYPALVAELDEELRHTHESGQPRIEETVFPKTNLMRVTVLWDKWDPVSDEDRATTILQAYEQVEGEEFRDRIALAIGLTIPEASLMGLLPLQVCPVVRPDDPVTAEQCREAMLREGASTLLLGSNRPVLLFATREEAESCVG